MNDTNDKLDDAADPTAIVGHSDFTNALAGALASGRMHHAWLLTGLRGIGKASMARLAAAWLLSEQVHETGLFGDAAPQFAVSPDDPGANLVFRGAHPDYLAIAPVLDDNKSGQIKINQIRDMVPFMAR
jgi:DNA polymerase-3 subunit delta'